MSPTGKETKAGSQNDNNLDEVLKMSTRLDALDATFVEQRRTNWTNVQLDKDEKDQGIAISQTIVKLLSNYRLFFKKGNS